jgi:hypothetical protein
MDAQLHLLQARATGPADRDPDPDRGAAALEASARWHLDDRTRALGRQGVAKARQALAAARRHHLEDAA